MPSLMHINNFWVFFASLLIMMRSEGQNFAWPLGGVSGLTGNYAEVRPHHFHAGIDLATGGKNLPIYSIADGYISRIKMSSFGYGKVVYITHPGGIVSVYAHQEKFTDEVFRFVRAVQEINETFEIEVFPRPEELPVKKGQLIGYSGNSGNSSGPHLHFEIRDEKSEIPLDPFAFLPLEDTIKPELNALAFYTFSKDNLIYPYKILFKKNFSDTHLVSSCSYVSASMLDRCIPGGNPNQVREVQLYLDDKKIYHHIMNGIHFNNNREVNGFSDHDLKKKYKSVFQKLFASKMNFLPIYPDNIKKGEIFISDTAIHTLEFVLVDIKQNETRQKIHLKKQIECSPVINKLHSCNEKQTLTKDDFTVNISDSVFFNDYNFEIISYNNNSYIGKVYEIRASETYFNKGIRFSVKIPPTTKIPPEKICAVSVENGIIKQYLGGIINNYILEAESKLSTGITLFYDTIAPKIKPGAWFKKPAAIKKYKRISFGVSDNLSGIDTYRIEINGNWILSEYDHKSGIIFFDNKADYWQNNNLIKIEVKDKQGNKTIKNFTIHSS